MKPHRILIMGMFPKVGVNFGGRQRILAFIRYYQSKGFQVSYASVGGIKRWPWLAPFFEDIRLSPYFEAQRQLAGNKELFLCSKGADDQDTQNRISKFLESLRPTLIQIEQPHLWPLISETSFFKTQRSQFKLFYDAHNLEYKHLTEAIRFNSSFGDSDSVEKLRRAEENLISQSDLVFATSHEEAAEMKRLNAKVIRVPNACETYSRNLITRWIWQAKRDRKFLALVPGSDHWPNIQGFQQYIEPILSTLPENWELWIAGALSNAVKDRLPDSKSQNIRCLGNLSKASWIELIHLSDLLILPITQGAGTNLRTAEALTYARTVALTPHALRGFEEHAKREGVSIVNSSGDIASIMKSFQESPLVISTNSFPKLHWESALSEALENSSLFLKATS